MSPPSAPGEIPLGPRTRAQAAHVLEQAMSTVWVALLEDRGPEGLGEWELVVDGLRLVKKRPAVPGNGSPPALEEASLPSEREG